MSVQVQEQEQKTRAALNEAIEKFDSASQRYYRHMAQLNGCPFLVVEDEEPVQKRLRLMLELHRRKVVVAGGVNEAISLLSQRGRKGFATIILDMGLPDGSGLDVLRWLRDQGWVVPVIVYTGMIDAEKYIGYVARDYPNLRVEQKLEGDGQNLAQRFGLEGS